MRRKLLFWFFIFCFHLFWEFYWAWFVIVIVFIFKKKQILNSHFNRPIHRQSFVFIHWKGISFELAIKCIGIRLQNHIRITNMCQRKEISMLLLAMFKLSGWLKLNQNCPNGVRNAPAINVLLHCICLVMRVRNIIYCNVISFNE